jgi:ATP phosphoribosyltransferase
LVLLLKGALRADRMVGLKMNVPETNLAQMVAILPSLQAPTIAPLYNTKWFSVEIIVDKSQVRNLIPQVIKHGATGIIEYPLFKVI